MDARVELQKLQAALEERARDAKFCFADVAETLPSHVANDVTVALNAYIEGRTHELPSLGDSVRR